MKSLANRATDKMGRILKNPKNVSAELGFLRHGLQPVVKNTEQVVFGGHNWMLKPELPIAVLWGFADWKHEHTPAYLPEYRTLFVRGNVSINKVIEESAEFWDEKNMLFIRWGLRKLPEGVSSYAKTKNIDIWSAEDGFLRSCGPHKHHSRPCSLVFDKRGVYFDGTRPSELEDKLNKVKSPLSGATLKSAEMGLAMMRAGKLSKYYALTGTERIDDLKVEGDHSALVLGQMPKDASIKFGKPVRKRIVFSKHSNSKLVERVLKEHPDTHVFYRPHPDERREKRVSNLNKVLASQVTTLSSDMPLDHAIDQVHHLYTYTSLSGLEAVIRGKAVTVLGLPFYAGWGLTNDKMHSARRSNELDLPSIFSEAYLNYPRYLHPASDELCTFFDVASYFMVERVKFGDVLAVPEHSIDLKILRPYQQSLPAPLALLLYLDTTPFVGSAETDKIMDIVQKDFKLADYNQFSALLIASSNYDALKVYSDFAMGDFQNNWPEYKYNNTLLNSFLAAYQNAQKNANGRPLKSIGDYGEDIAELVESKKSYYQTAVKYAFICSNNLNYSYIEKLLNALNASGDDETPDNVYRKISNILLARPTRSERNFSKRQYLLNKTAKLYKEALTKRYTSNFDRFLNSAMQGIALDNKSQVIKSFNLLISQFKHNDFYLSNSNIYKWGKLKKRFGDFYSIYTYLLKKGEYEFVDSMLENNFFPEKHALSMDMKSIKEQLRLSFYAAQAKHEDYIRAYLNALPRTQKVEKSYLGYARALRALGEPDGSLSILRDVRNQTQSPNKRVSIEAEISKIEFTIESSEILNSHPQPNLPKGVIIIASQTCYNTLAMMTPALVSLKKQGYAVVNLMEGMSIQAPTGIDYIDQFAGCLPVTLYSHSLNHDWEINWKEKYVGASGINFYQGFYERLSTSHRDFHVNLDQPAIKKSLDVQLKRSDLCLSICERIYSELVERGLNVAFISGNSHVTPFSVVRDFCRHKDSERLSFINCNVAYESYYSNLGSKFAHTMCVTDMTLHKNRRAPFMALKHRFENWYEENKTNPDLQERADQMIRVNRNSSKDNKIELELIKFLREQKESGKKIIACFGKVPVDLNVPYDGGPAHEDMADWVTHTVSVCGKLKDVILLVKPHPHELRPEIALDLISGFHDLIDTEIKDNIRCLGHKDINTHALAPFLDLAILYNGSSSLELTALGVPVMMCAHFGRHDYPVDLIYPKSRRQYEEYLAAGKYRKPAKTLRKKAAFLISYMGTDDISIRNEYSKRQVTNDKVGVPEWRKEKIKKFIEEGDPKMQLIASRIVEKFES